MTAVAERRVALVTGATTGLGRAEALALARVGRDVAVHAHRKMAAAEETAAACRAAGARTLVVQGDLTRADDVRRVVGEVVATLGRLDILVNNAGRVHPDMNAPLLGLFGVDDASPSPADVARMEEELTRHGKVHELHSYEGAGHAFFSVDRPSYRVEAAKDGWKQIWAWFGQHLSGQGAS